mgnify:CR=1 FL=1
MININIGDFDSSSGRRKIIQNIHSLEVKISFLAEEMKELAKKEIRLKKDVREIIKEE